MKPNYFIIDAARLLERMAKVNEFELQIISLYKESSQENLADYAPYLIDLKSAQGAFFDFLIENGIGDSWGIFIESSLSFDEIFKHLRKFLIVKDEEGQELYFRFYDPRVLRIFLPTCDSLQLREFFGPINFFFCEDEDPNYFLKFELQNDELITNRFLFNKTEIYNETLISNKDDVLIKDIEVNDELYNIV